MVGGTSVTFSHGCRGAEAYRLEEWLRSMVVEAEAVSEYCIW